MHDFNVFGNLKRVDFFFLIQVHKKKKKIQVHKDIDYLNKSMIVEGHKKCPFKEKLRETCQFIFKAK